MGPAAAGVVPPRPAHAVPSSSAPVDDGGTPPFTAIETRRLGPIRRWFARHPRGTDIVVALWFLLPSLISAAFPMRYPGVHWPLVALSTAALMLRRRHPLAVLAWVLLAAAISTVVTGGTGGQEWAVMLAIYAVASLRPPRVAWLGTGLSLLLLLAMIWFSLDTLTAAVSVEPTEPELTISRWQTFAGVASWTLAICLVAHAVGTSVRSRRLHTQDLVDRGNRIALERDQRAQLAAADERARIAREMHDVVAHSVSVMVSLADGATASLDKNPEQSRRALHELSATGRDALTEMRTILGALRTGERPDGGDAPFDGPAPLAPTVGDLDDLLARFRAAGLQVERVDRGEPLPTQRAFALTVYRVVQESLTNVLRHAPGATSVRVEIERTAAQVVVTVHNDAGIPHAAVHPGSGNGLLGLRERVAAYGGTVTAGPDGRGWRVRAELPIPDQEAS